MDAADLRLASEFRRLFLGELRRRGLTMADVARAYECSGSNVGQLVGGGRDLHLGTADALCKSIGLRLVLSFRSDTEED